MKCVVLILLSSIVIAASEHEESVRDASADESANRYVGYDQNKLGPGYRLVYIGQNIQRPGGDNAYSIRGHENIANYKYRFQNYNQQLGYNLGYGQNEDLGRGQQNVDHRVYGLNLGYPGVYGANQILGDKGAQYVIYDQGVNRGYEIQEEQPEEKIYRVINKQYHQYNRARGDH